MYNMIVNWPVFESEIQPSLNFDTLLDFVDEHVGEADLYRFENVASILSWLNADEMLWNAQCQVNAIENQQTMDSTIPHVLKPGTKITIRKPSASDIKFNDMESVQAYLSQGPSYQSNDEFQFNGNDDQNDSEEVDVTTFDFTPTWNHFHVVEMNPKSRKNIKVLTEMQPNATNINATKSKRGTIKANGLVESTHKCPDCEKSYKQKSSLLRHSKSHVPKEPGTEPVKKKPNKRSTKKNVKTHGIHPINNAEPIPT